MHAMIDPEARPAGGDPSATDPSSQNRENEKKKRSRVKQLLSDIKKQVEFWFGDVNLHKDRFLKQLIVDSRDGYVDISVLTTFNRMKKLTTDVKLIARALKNSLFVEVNLEGNKVRRQHALGENPKDVDSRTVYVELLPKDVKHAWIERVFSKCGTVVYVSIPRYKTTGHSKGFAFVEFEKEDQAQRAIEMLNNPPEDAPRKPGIFPKTKNGKPILPPPNEDVTQGEAEERIKKKKKKKKKSKVDALAKTSGKTKDKEMAAESSDRKRKRPEEVAEGEAASKQKNPARQTEKKRRRSQAAEAAGSGAQEEMPSKIRRMGQGDQLHGGDCDEKDMLVEEADKHQEEDKEKGAKEKEKDEEKREEEVKEKEKEEVKVKEEKREDEEKRDEDEKEEEKEEVKVKEVKVKEKREKEGKEEEMKEVKEEEVKEKEKGEEEEKGEDALLKAKRKRKKKNKEKLKIGEEVVPLRVISKHDWLELKQEYLTLQKQSMSSLKKCMTKIHQRGAGQQMETDNVVQHEQTSEKSEWAGNKENPQGPVFETGVIVKITHTKPLPARKSIKEILSEVSPVVYVDILDGDVEGHVRFKTPEDAKAVIDAHAELQRKHSWQLAILSGDHEQRYWQKILVDRQVKLNRPREKKRGTEKLISKAEKIVVARAKEASKHIRFLED